MDARSHPSPPLYRRGLGNTKVVAVSDGWREHFQRIRLDHRVLPVS